MTTQAAALTDEEVLAYTQGKRKELVEKITAAGMPGDKDDQRVLLEALSGMDRAALTTMKIKSEERVGNQHAQAATIIAEVLSLAGRSKPLQVENAVPRELPVLGNEIPVPTVIEGELDSTPAPLNYDTFMASQESGSQA